PDTKGHSHADLTPLDAQALRYQVADARSALQQRYHVPVNWFCYPSGHYDATVIEAVKRAGYTGSTTVVPGWAHPSDDRYRLPRLRVLGGTTPAELLSLVAGPRANPPAPPSYGSAWRGPRVPTPRWSIIAGDDRADAVIAVVGGRTAIADRGRACGIGKRRRGDRDHLPVGGTRTGGLAGRCLSARGGGRCCALGIGVWRGDGGAQRRGVQLLPPSPDRAPDPGLQPHLGGSRSVPHRCSRRRRFRGARSDARGRCRGASRRGGPGG